MTDFELIGRLLKGLSVKYICKERKDGPVKRARSIFLLFIYLISMHVK